LDIGFEIREEATQLTHENLKTGSWKSLQYREYDVNAEYPEVYPGKIHPLQRIIEEVRSIFIKLGFTESKGTILESAFWNFDCLFQPQDHAAREMQDTFYIKTPMITKLPGDELVRRVSRVHTDGGDTGSEGWGYTWDEEVARQSVLRTHTTCVSARFLKNNKPPLKMFSVGRVFRRETITYKHLPEFHQVEGIVAAEDINFQNLLGILKEFYRKLGFEVRFRPAYFPYTYLSTECEVYLPEKKSWIELGGSGMFRPEVLEPLGVETPVAAFGLGIERLAMIRLGIKDIRMLYQSDLGWLRNLPVTHGVKYD
jgi:phenylalanyl-tRNA synthetase alpha chain